MNATNVPISRVKIRYEQDVVYIRKQARIIAELLGFDRTDQTRIGIAVSEISRNAHKYAHGGEVEFMIKGGAPSARFCLVVRDHGAGIPQIDAILAGQYISPPGMGRGIVGCQRLLDYFHIETKIGQGTTVTLEKVLPPHAPPITPAILARIAKALQASNNESPLEEIRNQNEALLSALESLRQRDQDVTRINRELDKTNVQVLALNVELEAKAQSERAHTEILRSSDCFKQAILDSVKEQIAVLDPQGVILSTNASWKQASCDRCLEPGKLAAGTEVGANYLDACSRGGASECLEGIRSVLEGRSLGFDFEYPCDFLEQRAWYAMNVTPFGSNGIGGAVIVHVDITERERVDEMLRRLSLVVEQSPESIIITDLEANIEYVNKAFVQNTGYSRTEVIKANPNILQSGQTPPSTYTAMWSALKRGDVWKGELVNKRKDGSLYTESAVLTPIRRRSGRITHYVAVKQDITDKKQIDQELDQHRHHLEDLVRSRTAELAIERDNSEAANSAKSDFLANMSHEIRTPINAVLGFSFLCLNLALDPRARDYLLKIHSASESLLSLVNDILDFSKIDAGKLQLESISFSLDDVLRRVANLFSVAAHGKGLELVIGRLPEVPNFLLGDAHRLLQVLVNLISNALKFTEQGEISLLVECLSCGDGRVSLSFKIRDSGVGITQQQQSTLFAAFTQADSSTTRKYGGTGLGLALSQELVKCMGGEIVVESRVGSGSCFSFSVSFAVPSSVGAPGLTSDQLAGKKVLVVDNNDSMCRLLNYQTKAFGCQVEMVNSGQAALDLVDSGAVFDFILLDWHMPERDGLSTAHALRAAGYAGSCILITGDEPELARSLAEPGTLQAFLCKPVPSSILHDVMLDTLGGLVELPPQFARQHSVRDLSGVHILLVDDNDFNRQVGRELVEITGAKVDTANDGAQAVAAVEKGHYDLVLMDIQMPVMDGYSAARILRARWPDLPIIALTAHALVEERGRVLAAGMNDILTKPILPDLLYAALAIWLPSGGRAAKADLAVAASPGAIAPPTPLPTLPMPATEIRTPPSDSAAPLVFDLVSALTRVNGDRKMLDRFLHMFRERNAPIVEQIGAKPALPDLTAARQQAHALKGGAGTIGLLELQAAAARLESTLAQILQGTDPSPQHDDDFARLKTAWTRAQEALSTLLDTESNG